MVQMVGGIDPGETFSIYENAKVKNWSPGFP